MKANKMEIFSAHHKFCAVTSHKSANKEDCTSIKEWHQVNLFVQLVWIIFIRIVVEIFFYVCFTKPVLFSCGY
jgi:hypothetical protein